MIYYFSGTGNSKHAAETIAKSTNDTAVDIVDALKNGICGSSNDEKTGFVFPVYFWGLPEIIKRFASMPKVRKSLGKYVFCVITCGADTGSAVEYLEKALKRKMNYGVSLRMPDNYVVMYNPCTKEKAQKFLQHSDKELIGICTDINENKEKRETGFSRSVKSAVMSQFYNPFRKTKKFYADEKCVSCGLCAENCPDKAIAMKNGKPEWVKNKCQHCTACINRCPAKAIQFGKKTAERGRYNYNDTIK